MSVPHVVIVGGGFGGIATAQRLRRAPVRVTLVDRRNHHLFQPLLYQVATAALAPADVAEPIRAVLARQANAEVLLGEVTAVAPAERALTLADGSCVPYDVLVLAAGARHAYFGHNEWEAHAPGLKTVGDALEIRRRILTAYERAEWAKPADQAKWMTFVVVGAGPTGVEMAGAIADISRRTLARDFRHIDTRTSRIVLVEASDKVLGVLPAPLPERAKRQLERLGVEIRLGQPVTLVDKDGVVVGGERIEAATVIWAAGVQGSPIGASLGVPLDRAGRVIVMPDLSVPGHPEIFAIGDQAHSVGADGQPVPGLAPAALQMGKAVADSIRADLKGKPRRPFAYKDMGSMATIGRSKAVAAFGPVRIGGFIAWLMWVFVHLMTLVTFRNRVVVFVKWAWAWLTFDRSSRLLWENEPHAKPAPDAEP